MFGDGEATFTYTGHTVYFQDAASYNTKVTYLTQRHANLGGFAHWRVGAEDPDTWTVVAQVRTGTAATPAPPDFAISGSSTLSVSAGSSTTATYGITPINGFNADTNVSATMLDAFAGSVSMSAAVIRPGVTSTLTVSAASSAVAGTYRVRVAMTSGSLYHEQIVSVSVAAVPAPDFSLVVATQQSVTAGPP